METFLKTKFLSKDKIREIVFGNYERLVVLAKSKFFFLPQRGIPCEEIVNQAVINIFDVRKPFSSEQELLAFIEKNMIILAAHEKHALNDGNFFVKYTKNGGEINAMDHLASKQTTFVGPTDDFIRIYNIFEKARFGENDEKKSCNNCGCTSFYNMNLKTKDTFKCCACGRRMSLTAQTYVHNLKLSCIKLYRICRAICDNQNITTYDLAKSAGVQQTTAWAKRKVVLSIIKHVKSANISDVLYKMLTSKIFDEDKPDLEFNFFPDKFTKSDVLEIRRLVNNKIYKTKEVAEMYQSDPSNIRKIAKGIVYSKYPMENIA